MGAVLVPRGVSYLRYAYPTIAAKRDWKVLRKTGNLNSSGELAGPYGVVVNRS